MVEYSACGCDGCDFMPCVYLVRELGLSFHPSGALWSLLSGSLVYFSQANVTDGIFADKMVVELKTSIENYPANGCHLQY